MYGSFDGGDATSIVLTLLILSEFAKIGLLAIQLVEVELFHVWQIIWLFVQVITLVVVFVIPLVKVNVALLEWFVRAAPARHRRIRLLLFQLLDLIIHAVSLTF